MTAQQPTITPVNNQFLNNQVTNGGLTVNPSNLSQNIPPDHEIPRTKKVPSWVWFVSILLTVFVIIGLIAIILVPKNSITVEDQPLKKSVIIKNLSINKGGLVVIKTANRYNKPGNQNVGQSEYLPPDTYSDFTLDYFDMTPSSENNNVESQPLKSNSTLFAVVYEDMDNNFQISTADAIMKDWLGKQLITSFKIK